MAERVRLTNSMLRVSTIGVMLVMAMHAASASGPLRVCAENPRYFADATGKPVYLTRDQRLQAARIIAAYAGQRDTLTGPADPEALIDALVVVKDALLGGAEPTPEMWQALKAAQTQNVDDPEHALAPLRTRAVTDLIQLLTEEQKTALATPPTEELPQSTLGQIAAVRRLAEGQRENALAEALGAISRQVAPFTREANLPQIQATVADFAARLGDMAPQQAQQQCGELLQ